VFHALRGNHDEPVAVYLARVQDHKDGKTKGKPGPSLGIAVRMWPTPTAGDANGSGSRNTATSKAHAGISLTDAVLGDGGRGRMDAGSSGRLNPQWVEWLMGFPVGWTDCDASETPSFPKSPK
jgi:DNA (cytosine-5)-methyltransferase 1